MDELKKRVAYTLEKQIEGLRSLQDTLGEDFTRAIEIVRNRRGKIIVTGIGKSGFIGMKTAATLMSLGHMAHFLHPVEALHGDTGLVGDGDVIIAFSFSGSSPEVNRIVSYLKKTFDIRVVAVTGNLDSALAAHSDACFLVPVREEGCPLHLAPMASTTASLVVGDLIASALTSPDTFNKKAFAKFHPGGSLGLQLVLVSEVMLTGADIPLVKDSAPLIATLAEMTAKKRGIVGVQNAEGLLAGIVTDGDIRRFLMTHGAIEGKTAREAMTTSPKTIRGSETLETALSSMKKHKVSTLFVVDADGTLAGVVHMRTLLDEHVV